MALALILVTAGLPTRVSAFSVTIMVNTLADNTTPDTFCSLREAITNANNNLATYPDCTPGLNAEFINFASNLGTGTILLASPLPAISDANGLTINGAGKITVSGQDLYRVFYLNANVPLTLDGLTVAHGLGATDGGGAYVNPGAQLTILNSTFSNNRSSSTAGGVDNYGSLVITNSTFNANSAVNTGGGVVNNAGTLTITNSTFSNNASGYGGGLRSYAGTISITKSTFSGNSATSYGGAIYHYGGTLITTGSTFSTNTANLGGAIANITSLTIANSTFFLNSANIGGAVSNSYIGPVVGSGTILNSTFSNNTAIFAGFGVIYSDAPLSLSNTIIANSGLGSGDCAGTVTANSSNNLFEDAVNTCGLINGSNGNIFGVDPNLGPGMGSPVYLPLNGGSLAINAGDDAKCAAAPVSNTSQNGRTRPDGAHCDIGAYEADVTPPTVVSIVRAAPNPSSSASVTFTVTFSEPVYGVTTADFTLTTTGVTGAAVVPLSNGSGTALTVTVNTGSGSGTIRLNLVDRNTILDTANLYLGGSSLGDGSFNTGEVYTFDSAVTVTTVADNITLDGQCSLREAITNANNNLQTDTDCRGGSGADHILFASALGPNLIGLTSDLPAISDTSGLTINGGGKITISGNDLYRVFLANINVPLTLDSLTVAHGLGNNGGGAYVAAGGQLTILNSTFSNNHALVSGGGVLNHSGTLVITSSTFSGNSSDSGGGLSSDGGTTSITNSTFSGNTASGIGGGIFQTGGTLSITGSTFSTNTASNGGAIYNIAALIVANSTFLTNSADIGGAISNSYMGVIVGNSTILNSTFSNNKAVISGFGVIYNNALLSISNTIIANSDFGSGDCAGTVTIATSSNNLIEDHVESNACGLTDGTNGNIIGSDPNLAAATGFPAYLPLNGGSAAINAGNDAKCATAPVSNTSQNGRTRPDGAHCDIGAYEADATPPTVVSITRAAPNPTNSASLDFMVTFSEPVYGVTTGDFTLTTTGISGASVVSVSSSAGTALTVTVNTGTGSGTIRLNLIDRNTILDNGGNLYLGGPVLGDGSFTTGQVYSINRGAPGPYRSYLALALR